MDKEDKIVELELKIIDLKLERDKYVHRSIFSILVAVITFGVTSGTLANMFGENLKSLVISSFLTHVLVGIVVFVILMVGLPIFAYFITTRLIDLFLKSSDEIYKDRIRDIEKMKNDIKKSLISKATKSSKS